MGQFDEFYDTVRAGVVDIAKGDLKQYIEQGKADAGQFLQSLQADLETWTRQLANGDLSKDEFDFLVRGKADLAEMHALTQAGIAAVQLQRFRDALIDLVIESAFKVFVP